MMQYVGYVLLGLIVLLALWVIFSSKKVKWYKVYLANNDVMLLKRDLRERWWRTSDRYMRFKDDHGNEITFPGGAHWILMMEEVPDGQVELAREEIVRMKQARAEKEAE